MADRASNYSSKLEKAIDQIGERTRDARLRKVATAIIRPGLGDERRFAPVDLKFSRKTPWASATLGSRTTKVKIAAVVDRLLQKMPVRLGPMGSKSPRRK